MLQAATLRSLALAATAALAVFGSVAVGSAREDLLRGISQFSERYASSADLWVVHPSDNQTTKDFPADALRQRLEAPAGRSTRYAPTEAATSTSPTDECG